MVALYKTNKQFNMKTKLWKQNGRCLDDVTTALPIKLKNNQHELLRENKNNMERTDWKFRRVVENLKSELKK